MQKKIRNDRIVAIVMFVLAILIFVSSIRIPNSDLATLQMGPKTGAFPIFLAVLLLIFSITLFITAGLKGKSLENAPEEAEKVQNDAIMIEESFSSRIWRLASFLILMCVYFIILPYAGFMVSTTVLGAVFLITLFKERVSKSLLSAFVISILCYLIFELGLGIPLPAFLQAIKH